MKVLLAFPSSEEMEAPAPTPVPTPGSGDESKQELWSFQNAFLFVLLLVSFFMTTLFGSRAFFDIKRIKDDWPKHRCTPLIMPFAGFFGHNAKENFEFCMGNIFNMNTQSYLGTFSSIFGRFTGVIQTIFNTLNSLRNVIATLGGGINVIFQEFTERISSFFFRLRVSGIYMKSLFMRMYALLFSVMYLGMSGITGMTSFTNTFLFSFLDTFCFPGDTLIQVQRDGKRQDIPLREVKNGDRLAGGQRVTGCFQFLARGQPMVRLGSILVSTNHYVAYQGRWVQAGAHPDALPMGGWDSEEPLYCLNTDTHRIPIGDYLFSDYDETSVGDEEAMREVERHINAGRLSKAPFVGTEYGAAVSPATRIQTKRGVLSADEIRLGDVLSTGSTVVGVIHKKVTEYAPRPDGTEWALSTLYWEPLEGRWKRWGEVAKPSSSSSTEKEFCSFVVVPHSQLELEDGTRIRDYMEWCSPDAENAYTRQLEKEIP